MKEKMRRWWRAGAVAFGIGAVVMLVLNDYERGRFFALFSLVCIVGWRVDS